MTKRERVEELRHTMWRNMPSTPSTFGACCRCKTKSARGSGLCFDCAAKELAELVGRKAAEEYAAENGVNEIWIHSQEQAAGFYSALGYKDTGVHDVEEGCPHILMKKVL